jgi:regulator of sirC expression with transglutaminase-like and TPR domain
MILQIVESHKVSEILDREQTRFPRLDDAFKALTWWLARKPDDGYLLDDVNWIYRQLGNTEQNIPALVVIYTFDHANLFIEHILVRLPKL